MARVNRKDFVPPNRKTKKEVHLAKWKGVGDWIIKKYAEFLGSDELIDAINAQDFDSYSRLWKENIQNENWALSIAEYKNFLGFIRMTLPKRYSKAEFDSAIGVIVYGYGPITYEEVSALKDKESRVLTPTEDDSQEDKEESTEWVHPESTES